MNLKKIISFSLILLCIIYIIYLQFSNIDMTDTRLFVEHWKEYLIISLIIMINTIIFNKE